MRIAMFVGSFPLISETFILRQITGLLDLGHEVDIFAENRPPDGVAIHPEVYKYDLLARTKYIDAPPESTYWEMPVYPLSGETWLPDSDKPIPNMLRIINAGEAFNRCYSVAPRITNATLDTQDYGFQAASLSALYRLSALCSQTDSYDVAHAHFGPVGNSFRFVNQLWKVPFVVTFHGYDFSVVPRKEGSDVYQKLFKSVDAVTVNSEYAGERLKQLGCATEKIHKLRMGVNPEEFPYLERRPKTGEAIRALTVGRLTEKKGIEYSIRAVAQAREKYPEIVYEIIGDGPLRSNLENLIAEIGMGDSIILHGAQDGSFVQQKMSEAHIFILTSLTAENGDQEGTPVSLMEAQASGLPVLSTLHSGIPEVVINGRTGFLVPERNIMTLAERLIYLIENPNLCTAMVREGRQHILENFDTRKLNPELVSLYKKLGAK
jgi:colanic acid/amylovoran biosynthesis glycosyltransferase